MILLIVGDFKGVCMICVMEEHVRAVTARNMVTPWPIIKNLRGIESALLFIV